MVADWSTGGSDIFTRIHQQHIVYMYSKFYLLRLYFVSLIISNTQNAFFFFSFILILNCSLNCIFSSRKWNFDFHSQDNSFAAVDEIKLKLGWAYCCTALVMGTDIFNVFQIIVGGSSFRLITFHSDSHLGPVSYDYPIIYVQYVFVLLSIFISRYYGNTA